MPATIRVEVQQHDFDMAKEYQWLKNDFDGQNAIGAVVTFTGLVRDLADGTLTGMSLEHYPGMTERALTEIIAEAEQRWPLVKVTVIHRIGSLTLNEQIVFVGVASAHRKGAFAAAEFIMDFLKNRAPFWKKELTETGENWVAAKDSDVEATKKWQIDNEDSE